MHKKLTNVKTAALQFCGFILYYQAVAQVTPPSAYGGSVKINYVRTWDAQAPETNPNNLVTRPLKDVKQATAYFDGLGRPLQTVMKQGSLETGGTAVDMVSAVVYDEFGRQQYQYLPFVANNTGGNTSLDDGLFKLNPFQQQATYMTAQYGSQNETFFYGQTIYEASPLNRVLESFAPGNSWAGTSSQSLEANRRSVKMKNWLNTTTDDVKKWSVSPPAGGWGTYSMTGEYSANELFKNVSVDEHGKQVIEFKDKEGKVLLKKVQLTATADAGTGSGYTGWLSTYYIYDDLNNLRLVVQPKGIELLIANSWSITALSNAILNEQCFRYEYDLRNRMIRKKVPGAGEVWMVYDARDRLVMTQDANQRTQGKWMYTEYDALNRLFVTGIIYDNHDLAYHAALAAGSTAYPQLNIYNYELLTHTVYDNYDWLQNYTTPFSATRSTAYDSYFSTASNTTYPYPQALTQSSQTKNMVTGIRVFIQGTGQAFWTINYYDDKGRIIQTQSTNITGGVDIATTQYNWAGQPLTMVTRTEKTTPNAQEHIIITKMDYDDLGRLLTTKKTISSTINSQSITKAEQVIASHEYDKMGQLKKKTLGATGGEVENLVYDYNIRGWLLGANRSYMENKPGGAYQQHYFGFELGYDKQVQTPGGGNDGLLQYNGNISIGVWKSAGDEVRRKYNYWYDEANRLNRADFYQNSNATSGTGWTANELNFTLSGYEIDNGYKMKYDANGNILLLKQAGWKAGQTVNIDALQYTYNSNSNKLYSVTDAYNDPDTKLGDFHDGTNGSAADYDYDGNGNLIKDENKKISSITYNHLNLPQTITVTGKGTITYTYDAAGNKLKKEVAETGQSTKTTLYLGGLVYENDVLQFIPHEEGRLRYAKKYFLNGDSTYQFIYDYFIKDHLGNVRMVLTEQKDTTHYMATMEAAYRAKEEQLFYNIPQSSYSKTLVPGGYPTDNTTSPNDSVARVNGSDNKTGPSLILKVMSGDVVDIGVKSFYRPNGSAGGNSNPINDILSSLASGIVGVAGEAKGTLTQLNNTSTSPLLGALNSFITNENPNPPSGKPKAYLNWILLDEQFNYTEASSGAIPVGNADVLNTLASTGIPITKNGFLYIYVSNETQNWNVFFDNLAVQHYTGPIVEETHYYPFGLTMAGISSKALKPNYAENKYKFNGIEQNSDFDLNMYDAFYRNIDPQIGRFWQIDPETDNLESYSPYESMGNNPVNNVDPLGDFRARSGAWWHRLWHGGGEIKKNEYGEWYVEKTRTETTEDENVAIVSYRYYGKGRNQYTAAGEDLEDDLEKKEQIDHMVELGVLDRHNTQQEANEANFKAFTGVLLPNVIKSATTAINTSKAAKGGGQLLLNAAPANLTQKGLEHIIARHWFTSGAKGAGKFAQGTTGASLKEMIHTATTQGTFRANTAGRAGTIAEYNFGRVIGTTSGGAPASNLRVVIGTNGNVITAFPY